MSLSLVSKKNEKVDHGIKKISINPLL